MRRDRITKQWGYFVGPVRTWWDSYHPRDMTIERECVFVDKRGTRWTVPDGTRINGASTPWLFRRVFPAYIGWYRRATVFHDRYCETRERPSRDVHRMFRECMLADGTHPITAWIMWAAVRVFGPRFKGDDPSEPTEA